MTELMRPDKNKLKYELQNNCVDYEISPRKINRMYETRDVHVEAEAGAFREGVTATGTIRIAVKAAATFREAATAAGTIRIAVKAAATFREAATAADTFRVADKAAGTLRIAVKAAGTFRLQRLQQATSGQHYQDEKE